jgi:hypothetical protein
MRLRGLAKCQRAIHRTAETTIGAFEPGFNQMKKPTLHVEQQLQPRNVQRADIAPANGYAMVVDGHFKAQFAEEGSAKKDAAELLAKYPMLKIEIYDASSKGRTLVK